MKRRITVFVLFILSIVGSGCTSSGGYYYAPPVYDGYIVSTSPKQLPKIKDNNDIKIP